MFLTAVASCNGGGCVGSSAVRELIMSCSYIIQVVVVTRIVKSAEFL